MAEKQAGRSAPPGRYTKLWMASAVVLVAAFLAWLAVTSEPSSLAVVEETEDESGATGGVVSLDQFAVDVLAYTDRDVSLANLSVAGRMGSQAFWIELPNGTPFLVKLGGALVSEGFSVQSGDVVAVLGRVHPMTDSVMAAWEQSGAIQDEGQRMEAQYSEAFLEVSRARVQGEPGAESE